MFEKGYKILDIHEINEYPVIQYNPETGQDGLFVDYTNTFLKLKAEASGYPSCVRILDDDDRYVEMLKLMTSSPVLLRPA